jgi:hypothetical protein
VVSVTSYLNLGICFLLLFLAAERAVLEDKHHENHRVDVEESNVLLYDEPQLERAN